MSLTRASMISSILLMPGVCLAQEKEALGQWTPYFKVGQIFVGDTVISPGKITFDNKLTLRIGSPGVVIPGYKLFSKHVEAMAYPISGDATHIILRNNYPICRGEQPQWIVLAVSYEKGEDRIDLSVTLSMEDPRHPTSPDNSSVAEKACALISYVPGTMAKMGGDD